MDARRSTLKRRRTRIEGGDAPGKYARSDCPSTMSDTTVVSLSRIREPQVQNTSRSHTAQCLKALASLETSVDALVTGTFGVQTELEFYEELCQFSIEKESCEEIEEYLLVVNDQYRQGMDLMNEILGNAGVGEAWRTGDRVCAKFRRVIVCLEDIVCYHLEGLPALSDALEKRRLAYYR